MSAGAGAVWAWVAVSEMFGGEEMMSETPETDAFYGELSPNSDIMRSLREHARSLERRLAAAEKALAVEKVYMASLQVQRDEAQSELDGVLTDEQVAAMADAWFNAGNMDMPETNRRDRLRIRIEAMMTAMRAARAAQERKA